MPNPALTEKIRNLPPLLDSLERDAEVSDLLRRSDAARERFRQMFPLDGVEQSALEDYRKESPPVALRMAWPMRNDSLKRSGR